MSQINSDRFQTLNLLLAFITVCEELKIHKVCVHSMQKLSLVVKTQLANCPISRFKYFLNRKSKSVDSFGDDAIVSLKTNLGNETNDLSCACSASALKLAVRDLLDSRDI